MSAPDEATGSRGEVEALAAIRGRDRDVVARIGNPGRDPLLRAEMDRRWLLAEIDRLGGVVATARAEERERIAQAIEATMRTNPDCRCCRDAARIARTEPDA